MKKSFSFRFTMLELLDKVHQHICIVNVLRAVDTHKAGCYQSINSTYIPVFRQFFPYRTIRFPHLFRILREHKSKAFVLQIKSIAQINKVIKIVGKAS